MKIDYTNYLSSKKIESDENKLRCMKSSLVSKLKELGVHGIVNCVYYSDGCIKVSINGKYYNIFNCNTEKFFCGYVGDR